MSVIKIPLTQGKEALVEEEDVSTILAHRWCAVPAHSAIPSNWYALRHGADGEPSVVYMHQEILSVAVGLTVDHINGDGLDNRRGNLRPATMQQQKWNSRPRPGTSRFKGVSWSRDPKRCAGGRWICKIVIPSGRAIVKHTHNEVEAARLYNALAREHFGDFAWLNPMPVEVE